MTIVESAPIYSAMGDDPELRNLVTLFVSELPLRLEKMQAAAESEDRDGFRRLVHQLKGAAGSYGFHDLTPEFQQVEDRVRNSGDLREAFATMTAHCSRMRPGVG